MPDADDEIAPTLERMRRHWPRASAAQAGTVIAVQRLSRLLHRAATRALAPLGLTPAEFECLAALRAHAPPHRLTPSDLYGSMLMSSGGLTKLLRGLEARSLVQRSSSADDGRSRPVELSPEGRALAEQAMAAVQAAEAPMIEAMAAAWREGADLAPGLVALATAAEAAERGGPGEPVGGQGRPSIRAGGSGGAGRRG